MQLIAGILLIMSGAYLVYFGCKVINKESESGWPRNGVNLILFSAFIVFFGIVLIYKYFKS